MDDKTSAGKLLGSSRSEKKTAACRLNSRKYSAICPLCLLLVTRRGLGKILCPECNVVFGIAFETYVKPIGKE